VFTNLLDASQSNEVDKTNHCILSQGRNVTELEAFVGNRKKEETFRVINLVDNTVDTNSKQNLDCVLFIPLSQSPTSLAWTTAALWLMSASILVFANPFFHTATRVKCRNASEVLSPVGDLYFLSSALTWFTKLCMMCFLTASTIPPPHTALAMWPNYIYHAT
jgi:hypothetical protein